MGHCANKCPEKRREVNSKKKAPGDNETQIKTVNLKGKT
jgi:hypothetical protein